jgi:hypothetical protein
MGEFAQFLVDSHTDESYLGNSGQFSMAPIDTAEIVVSPRGRELFKRPLALGHVAAVQEALCMVTEQPVDLGDFSELKLTDEHSFFLHSLGEIAISYSKRDPELMLGLFTRHYVDSRMTAYVADARTEKSAITYDLSRPIRRRRASAK